MKEHNGLEELFVEQLQEMLSTENQIVEALPKLIDLASLPDLKEGLSTHLKETKTQVSRLKEVFKALDMTPTEKTCEAMRVLLKQGEELITNSSASDAAIIISAQKVEHFEMASYGALRSFAKQLGFESKIVDLLQSSLDEEGAADKKLTKIAEGGFFFSGVNKKAIK